MKGRFHYEVAFFHVKDMNSMSKNEGKKFEEDIKASVPENCWIYRLRDNASSFAGGSNTRFTSSNICDYILFDDISKSLFLIECKSTKGTSIPLTMIRDNQMNGLLEASKHNLTAGFIINFRNKDNDTYFISIENFQKMINSATKKSFNLKDLHDNAAVKISSIKKRTRYIYNIQELINTIKV